MLDAGAEPRRMDPRDLGRRKHQLVVAVHDEARRRAQRRIGERLDDDLRPDAERIAHGDADEWTVHRSRAFWASGLPADRSEGGDRSAGPRHRAPRDGPRRRWRSPCADGQTGRAAAGVGRRHAGARGFGSRLYPEASSRGFIPGLHPGASSRGRSQGLISTSEPSPSDSHTIATSSARSRTQPRLSSLPIESRSIVPWMP